MVIVDTSVWISYFRASDSPVQSGLRPLLEQDAALAPGIVITELLRGARSQGEFDFLLRTMRQLPRAAVTEDAWVRCGEISYELRRQGVTIGLTDALIAAIAIDGGHEVYTLDTDFGRVPGLRLHTPSP